MAGALIKAVKPFVPKAFIDLYKSLFVPKVWTGNYSSWAEAEEKCEGYATDEILQKVLNASLQVQKGEAAYEQDSVLFFEPRPYEPLLQALRWAQKKVSFPVNIVDFGGSLGSLYHRHQMILKKDFKVFWNVVEQSHYVDQGIKFLQTEDLRFFKHINEVPKLENEMLILASVLPYLPDPWEFLEKTLADRRFNFIWVDRTYFQDRDRLTIQKVPPSIYRASYPCWFFDQKRLMGIFQKHGYKEAFSFQCDYQDDIPAAHRGFLLYHDTVSLSASSK